MSSTLQNTGELRAEYKIERLSLRGGYRYEQSPYQDKTTIGDLTGYSGGLGYNLVLLNLIYPMRTPKENHNKAFSRKALLTEQK
jgi:hypothetical protein